MKSLAKFYCRQAIQRQSALLTLFLLSAWLVISYSQVAKGQQTPGAEIVFNVAAPTGNTTLIFRHCPAGKLIPGQPVEPIADKQQTPAADQNTLLLDNAGPVSIDSFYMTESEITIKQFQAVLGPAAFSQLKTIIAEENSGAADLIQALEAGGDFPIFMVRFQDAVDFTKRLNDLESQNNVQGNQIEVRRFRLPTHYEWQYAARGVLDNQAQPELPHFNCWPDGVAAMNKEIRQKCEEEWKELYGANPAQEFTGAQGQVIKIVNDRNDPKSSNTKPLEILSAFINAGIRDERNYAENKSYKLAQVKKSAPNAWQIYNMHDNVPEWVLAIKDRGSAQKFWNELQQAGELPNSSAFLQQNSLLLAGGSFESLMTGENAAWKQFTIWGSFPMNKESGAPLPKKLANQDEFKEKFPGLRILMERVVSDDWLMIVRQNIISKNELDTSAFTALDKNNETFKELVPPSRLANYQALLELYRAWGLYRQKQYAEAAALFNKVRSAAVVDNQAAPKKALDDLLGDTKPAAKPKKVNDDQLYLTYLGEALVKDRDSP